MAAGILRIQSFEARRSAPAAGVTVTITGQGFSASRLTDDAGNTQDLEIDAPDQALSLEEDNTTIQSLLERQVMSSVYMEDTIRRMAELGVDTIVEIGPGKVLSGFVKKTAADIKTYAITTAGDLQSVVAELKGAAQ